MTLQVAVLISGTGSNLRALLEAIDTGECDARVTAVLSDRDTAAGLQLARERRIPTRCVRLRDHADREAWNHSLARAVSDTGAQLVVLAGFMRVLGKPLLDAFPERILNVHPALLPSFPGKDGPGDALTAGVRISGCTVHLVDEGVDTGPILAQAAVPVLPDDTRDRLHGRIQRAEHRLLPRVVHWVSTGMLVLGRRPHLEHVLSDDRILFVPDPSQ